MKQTLRQDLLGHIIQVSLDNQGTAELNKPTYHVQLHLTDPTIIF